MMTLPSRSGVPCLSPTVLSGAITVDANLPASSSTASTSASVRSPYSPSSSALLSPAACFSVNAISSTGARKVIVSSLDGGRPVANVAARNRSRKPFMAAELATRFLDASRDAIAEGARVLRDGGLVALPTETVYGLGADATNGEAVARLYAAKG